MHLMKVIEIRILKNGGSICNYPLMQKEFTLLERLISYGVGISL
jgi:hypothetical protein